MYFKQFAYWLIHWLGYKQGDKATWVPKMSDENFFIKFESLRNLNFRGQNTIIWTLNFWYNLWKLKIWSWNLSFFKLVCKS